MLGELASLRSASSPLEAFNTEKISCAPSNVTSVAIGKISNFRLRGRKRRILSMRAYDRPSEVKWRHFTPNNTMCLPYRASLCA